MALMEAMCAYSALPHSLNEHTFIANGSAPGSVIFTVQKNVLRWHARGGEQKTISDQAQMKGKYLQLGLSDWS